MVWTRTDARKHDIGAIDVMCVVCFINIIKQKHIICRRKFLRFCKLKTKILKNFGESFAVEIGVAQLD